jgi:type IV pilus assembly protein PilW
MNRYTSHHARGRPAPPGGTGPGRRTHEGFALVELMIALALGLVIVAALGQLYAGSKQSYALSDAMARLDENGRFTADFLSNDLRMAGYLSCGGSTARVANSVNSSANWYFRSASNEAPPPPSLLGIEGFEGGVDTPPADFVGQVRSGTDILIVRRASPEVERSLLQDDSASKVMKLGLDHGFEIGEILVVTNPTCTQASILQVTDVLDLDHPLMMDRFDAIKHDVQKDATPGHGTYPGNCTASLFGSFDCNNSASAESGVFSPGSTLSRFSLSAYYITAADPPTLVRKRLGKLNGEAVVVTDELVRDVENFQVVYGRDTVQDTNHRVDDYVTANLVTNWSSVVSVRFALLLRSHEPTVRSAATSNTYDLVGTTATSPLDRRLRRTFGGVIALRNNLP